MGQAALDLPDPLEAGPPDAMPVEGAAGTDELLAQLAGDEINRLLAEADLLPSETEGLANGLADAAPRPAAVVPAAPAAPSTPAAPRGTAIAASPPGADPVLDSDLDDLVAKLSAAVTGAPVVAAPSGAPRAMPAAEEESVPPQVMAGIEPAAASPGRAVDTDPAVSAELDQVFEQMTAGGTTGGGEFMVSGRELAEIPEGDLAELGRVLESAVARDAEQESAPKEAAGQEFAGAASPEEKSALTEVVGPAGVADAVEQEPGPWHVGLLAYFNAPRASVPQPVLDAAGKVAILTLINAAAVLLYVLLFRRR